MSNAEKVGAIDYDALLAKLRGQYSDTCECDACQGVTQAIEAIRALRAALQDAETGELKNALAVGQACIELQEERRANEALRAALAESERDAVTTEMCAAVRLALHRAYGLGQTYFQQADSESYTQNKNADKTASKFKALADSVEDLLLSNSATRLAAMAAQEKANG